MYRGSWTLLLAVLMSCGGGVDEDGDGATADVDCDDGDPAVHPGAEDLVGDGFDANCDQVDGVDKDGDGVASIESGGQDCDDNDASVTGVDFDQDGVLSCLDCDDDDPAVYPGATEICDGVDQDCDGAVDIGTLDRGVCSHEAEGGGLFDFIVVVDNSCSMYEEQARMASGAEAMLQVLVDAGTDFHVSTITTDTADQGAFFSGSGRRWIDNTVPWDEAVSWFQTALQLGTAGSATEQGRDSMYQSVEVAGVPGGPNDGFHRADAHLAVLYLSDENDYSTVNTVPQFQAWFEGLKADPSLVSSHAVITPETIGTTPCIGAIDPGLDYIALAQATGGHIEEICADDYGPVMVDIATDFGSGSATTFEIPEPLDPATLSAVISDSSGGTTDVPNSGLLWNASTSEAQLLNTDVPPGGSITFYFGLLPQ